jgi:tetratricopeptide (TPR) repeat protein
MLSLEERADLLVRVAELHRAAAFNEITVVLAACSDEDLCAELDLGYSLAMALHRTGQFAAAKRLNALLLARTRAKAIDRLYRKHLILRGALSVESGDLFEAESSFYEAMASATRSGDNWVIADVMMNLGILSWIGCRWDCALASFERALTAYTVLGRRYNVAACHQNMGMTYREMPMMMGEADSHFETAHQLYSSDSTDRSYELSLVETERALLIHKLGDAHRAEAMARRALARVVHTGGGKRHGEALRALGIALGAQGRVDEARESLQEACRLAESIGNRLLEAEACEELSNLEPSAGRSSRARKFASRAIRIYRAMGAIARARAVRDRIGVLTSS